MTVVRLVNAATRMPPAGQRLRDALSRAIEVLEHPDTLSMEHERQRLSVETLRPDEAK
ncbi:MAG: hypothetical protein ABWY12_11155 [Burkholderiales bacterium]